ncbi:hypothetical protein KKE14_02985, partial [Patescibacteria group bacterium]|nr:hypothetical protein [Patescibacteria group bacterium]
DTPSSLTRLSICSFISLLITDLDILASFLLTHHTVRTNCLNFGVPATNYIQKQSRQSFTAGIKQLQGTIASVGKTVGKVRILHSSRGDVYEELSSIKKGDILVTEMTRPQFISAMKLASAIVTDEGGLTSHAAIIARELKIPCIVGTKVATQVLHDGDLVDVDANKGIVKILKKI